MDVLSLKSANELHHFLQILSKFRVGSYETFQQNGLSTEIFHNIQLTKKVCEALATHGTH